MLRCKTFFLRGRNISLANPLLRLMCFPCCHFWPQFAVKGQAAVNARNGSRAHYSPKNAPSLPTGSMPVGPTPHRNLRAKLRVYPASATLFPVHCYCDVNRPATSDLYLLPLAPNHPVPIRSRA